jgi:hypothetical protein
MNSSAETSAALAAGTAESSPVTELYNAGLQKDYRFVGDTNNCVATTGGETAGCVMTLDITNGFPTVNVRSTALAAAAGTSGIIVDENDSSLNRSFERLRCDRDRRRSGKNHAVGAELMRVRGDCRPRRGRLNVIRTEFCARVLGHACA